jgi:chromosome partitioning protein
MCKSICIFSRKGGVGKTLTAVNLSAALASAGHKTLLVDCDPQGSATKISAPISNRFSHNLGDVILGKSNIKDTLIQGCLYYLKLIPAPENLSLAELVKLQRNANKSTLKRQLERIKSKFQYVIIDTPASESFFILNALAASDVALIVVQCEYLAYRSLSGSLKELKIAKGSYNPHIKLAGILVTMHENTNKSSDRILSNARKHLNRWLFNTIIPKDKDLGESPSMAKPLVVYKYNSNGAKHYKMLATEVLNRLG